VDGLWFLVAIAVLRFAWRFIERASRQAESDPQQKVEDRKARRERRRARRVPPPRPQPGTRVEPSPASTQRPRRSAPRRPQMEPTAYAPAPPDAPSRPLGSGDLLERLREAVEAASGMRAESPREVPIPMPVPRREALPPSPPRRRDVDPTARRDIADVVRRTRRDDVPAPARASAPARHLQELLRDPASLREVVLLREIIGPSVAQRGRQRLRHLR